MTSTNSILKPSDTMKKVSKTTLLSTNFEAHSVPEVSKPNFTDSLRSVFETKGTHSQELSSIFPRIENDERFKIVNERVQKLLEKSRKRKENNEEEEEEPETERSNYRDKMMLTPAFSLRNVKSELESQVKITLSEIQSGTKSISQM